MEENYMTQYIQNKQRKMREKLIERNKAWRKEREGGLRRIQLI